MSYAGPRGMVPGNPGRSQFRFSEAQLGGIQRSTFDRPHGTKTTFDEGYLIPIYVDEVLPGDTFNMHMTAMCRMTTPEFPLFDNLYLETFWFFVPLYRDWETDRKSTRLNSSHITRSRMPSSA